MYPDQCTTACTTPVRLQRARPPGKNDQTMYHHVRSSGKTSSIAAAAGIEQQRVRAVMARGMSSPGQVTPAIGPRTSTMPCRMRACVRA